MTGTCYGERDSFLYDQSINQDILSSMAVETRCKTNVTRKPLNKTKLAGVYNIMNKNRYANFTQMSKRRGKTKIDELEAKKIKMFELPLAKVNGNDQNMRIKVESCETTRSTKLSRKSLTGLSQIPITFQNVQKISKKPLNKINDLKINFTPKNFNDEGIKIKIIKVPGSKN